MPLEQLEATDSTGVTALHLVSQWRDRTLSIAVGIAPLPFSLLTITNPPGSRPKELQLGTYQSELPAHDNTDLAGPSARSHCVR